MLRAVIEAVCNAVFWGIGLSSLVWCLQAVTRRTNAGTRHAVWCFTLAAVVLLPVLILCAHRPSDAPDAVPSRRATATPFQRGTVRPGESDPPLSQDFVYLFTGFWTCGSLLMLVRLGWSARRLRRLLRAATPLPSADIPIYSSPDIASPMAAGVLSPAILLPAVLEPRLTEAERRHMILHETAHIRRRDPGTNLAQRLAEALFFFHPAVWWIGRQLRFEREIACDDWVVAATGHAKPYAAALARLVELTAFRRGPILATGAATGRRQISRRIEMLLDRTRNRSPHPEQFGLIAAASLLTAAMLCCAYAPSIFAFSGSQSAYPRQVQISYSNFWSSFTLKSRGDIKFADDDRDVKSISADGSLMLEERQGLTWRKLTFTPRGNAVERSFFINGMTEPFEPDGRQSMSEMLPRVIRETGIGASARVARILRQGGPTAVLAEISRIDNNHSKRVYFQELIARSTDSELLQRVLRQATHELDSDGERRRLLASLLDRGTLLPELLQSAARLNSDGEKAAFLIQTVRYFPADETTRTAFFRAVNTIGSDGERRRVLGSFIRRPLRKDDLARAFDATAKLHSDGEKTWLLVQGAGEISASTGVRRAWFSAVDTISSDGEHRRALEAALRGYGRDRETLTTIIRSATRISSDGEKARILSLVARDCPDDDEVIQAVVESAQTLHSDGEYQRVITPLMRKGRGIRIIRKI